VGVNSAGLGSIHSKYKQWLWVFYCRFSGFIQSLSPFISFRTLIRKWYQCGLEGVSINLGPNGGITLEILNSIVKLLMTFL